MSISRRNFLKSAAAVAGAAALAGCSSSSDDSSSTGSSSSSSSSTSTGSVYYLNFKPEQDEDWQELAASYTEQTGVQVDVVTAASGEYETTLMAEMSKSSAPTLFQVNGPVGLASWTDYCYDLSGTDVYGELTSDSYALIEDNEVKSIAYVYESYGLICNTALLEQAGYTLDDISSWDDLKTIAEDITARQDELGFAAFSSAGTDSSSYWRFTTHLANMPIYFEYQDDGISSTDAIKGTYLDEYRNMWDLYLNNSTCDPSEVSAKTADDSESEFANGQAVFFQNGSWEYSNLTGAGMTDDQLAMIPLYIGVGDEANQGLCDGTENYWCVNKEASEDDIQATLDFMYWCVTSDEGTAAMADNMGFVIPFNNAQESSNLFVQQDVAYTADGKTPISWAFTTIPSETWKDDLASALTAYAADMTDDTWAQVQTAFVDGWATEYAAANEE